MSPLENIPRIITASIGPIEQRATKPKLFSPAFLPPSVPAIPTPSAIMNGTVIGPVVTPPESNASGRNSSFPITRSAPNANKHI